MSASRTVVVRSSTPDLAGDTAGPWALGWRVWRWPVADVALGVGLTVVVLLALGPVPATVPASALALATPVLWRVDVAERRLPNALVLPCGAFALGAVLVTAVVDGAWPARTLISAGVTAAFFLVLNAGGGMGMGDVKLAVVLAVVLALVRVDAVVAAALVAFFSGGVAALIVHLRSRARSIPFGPFLLAGFWTALALAG
jgi:leader peptidase (prepilin peptidase)/N-methyltransferase